MQQQLKIPQSPFVTNNGMVATEWLVFLNEFIRLCNNLITNGTIDAASEAIQLAAMQRVSFDDVDQDIIELTPLHTAIEQPVENVAIQINQDDNVDSNPYAQLSAIEQQLYDQQIWNLTV